ncbi:uncharacterized protein LOC117100523 [Anneissia japonica]|uniref:uncharacterized protein LOC117100523 n=1 Tax=Anneissia japonica TaxID=1529436 RepID=UPI001425A063|nr:uncharacterized protein LOC117100523 [Anneissia japonica]
MENGTRSMPARCVADSAQYIHQVISPNDVVVNRWKYFYESGDSYGVGEGPREYTKDECQQTGTSFVGKYPNEDGGDIIRGTYYYNYQELTDVSEYFILPSYCNSP